MDEAKLLAFLAEIADDLRADIAKLAARVDEVSKLAAADAAGARDRGVSTEMQNRGDTDTRRRHPDEYPADPEGARLTAADSVVDPAMFRALASTVNDMQKKQARPMRDLNAYADVQAKADAVLRAHNERAEPPMAGEELIPYTIRMHRKMQRHSKKWKGVELNLIAADHVALNQVCDQIRSDAMEASMNTEGMPLFQHRMITKQTPGGHTTHEFVGNGSFIKQMSRPIRHVSFIGTRNAG